jgi:hypothetical protein
MKLKTLLEGFAWERKEGKPLPTMAEVQAEYEKKLQEDAQNEAYGSFGGRRNKAADEYRPSYKAASGAPEGWDELMDKVNNDPKYKVYSDTVVKLISNLETDVTYRIRWNGAEQEWEGKDPETREIIPVEDLIAMAQEEILGMQKESVITEEEYKVAGRPVTLIKNGTEDQTKWEVKFQNGDIKQYADVMSLIKPRPKLQDPRWQDNDGDGKWYEKGDDVKESVLKENMRRFGTKNI